MQRAHRIEEVKPVKGILYESFQRQKMEMYSVRYPQAWRVHGWECEESHTLPRSYPQRPATRIWTRRQNRESILKGIDTCRTQKSTKGFPRIRAGGLRP